MTDDLPPERLNREQLRARQYDRLRSLLTAVVPANPFWTRSFRDAEIDAAAIRDIVDLRQLPLTTKADLVADHEAHPPFGSNLTYDLASYSRMHQTSGTTGRPLRWLDTPESWTWFANCWGQIFRLAGVTRADRAFFPFSFGPFIGFWAAFEGASRLGNLVIPGGGMSSEARLKMIAETQATVVCCTPTYALRLAEVAEGQGIDLASSTVQRIVVAGEPGGNLTGVRDRIESAWGAVVIDHWGMTELGSLATAAEGDRTGLYMLEAECIAEVLDPKTLLPAEEGELGELIVTNLGRVGSPLIRYRTGDLVRVSCEPSPIGLDLLRFEGGILGRSDDMVTIRGNNVFPTSVEAVVREFADVAEFRIVIQTVRSMKHLRLELEPVNESASEGLTARVGRSIKDRLNFVAEVVCVPCGSLPRFDLKGRRLVRDDL
ncbi:MAG: AMP-binding protein [Planctomycetota bacterium]|nr:AMP-binding protein [Planctomycetaceae bacterium]MDQ3329608.1 AMP-binding protein [Planctomycetota bacterium]